MDESNDGSPSFEISGKSVEDFISAVKCLGKEIVIRASPWQLVLERLDPLRRVSTTGIYKWDFFDKYNISRPLQWIMSLKDFCDWTRIEDAQRLTVKMDGYDPHSAKWILTCSDGNLKTDWITCNVEYDEHDLSLDGDHAREREREVKTMKFTVRGEKLNVFASLLTRLTKSAGLVVQACSSQIVFHRLMSSSASGYIFKPFFFDDYTVSGPQDRYNMVLKNASEVLRTLTENVQQLTVELPHRDEVKQVSIWTATYACGNEEEIHFIHNCNVEHDLQHEHERERDELGKKMEFAVSGSTLKNFAKFITCLANTGNEFLIQASSSELVFHSLGSPSPMLTFRRSFFDSYAIYVEQAQFTVRMIKNICAELERADDLNLQFINHELKWILTSRTGLTIPYMVTINQPVCMVPNDIDESIEKTPPYEGATDESEVPETDHELLEDCHYRTFLTSQDVAVASSSDDDDDDEFVHATPPHERFEGQ